MKNREYHSDRRWRNASIIALLIFLSLTIISALILPAQANNDLDAFPLTFFFILGALGFGFTSVVAHTLMNEPSIYNYEAPLCFDPDQLIMNFKMDEG